MAVLPSKYSLSQPSTFVSGRPIAQQDTTGVGRGLASLGQSVVSLGDDIQRQRDTVDIARAEAAKSQGLIDVKNQFTDDGDYSTFTKRAPAATSDVVTKASDLIRNPAMREKWKLGAGTDAARMNDAIGDKAHGLGQQAEKVALDDSMETQRRIYVDPNSTDDERAKAKADIQGTISTALGNGLLTPDEANARKTTYVDNANFSRAKLQAEVNPGAVASWNPNKATDTAHMFSGIETQYGVPNGYLSKTMQIESGGRDTGANSAGASGYFQFIPSTASHMGVDPHSLPSSADGAARLAVENGKYLSTGLGRAPTAAELYLAHQQGAAGATKLLNNPNANAASLVGTKAVIQNGGKEDMTAGEFAQMWENKFNGTGGATQAGPAGHQTQIASNAPDWFKQLSPEEQQVAYQQADTKIKQQQVAARGNIETVVQNAPAAIQNTGTYDGSTPTHQQFVDAYGPQEGPQKYQQFSAALDVAQSTFNFRTESADDIQRTVEAARPTSSGNDAEIETKKYDALSTAATQTLAARKADPATYARQAFPSVDQAWNDAATSGNYAAAMTATAVAQQQLGIKNMQLLPKSVAEQSVATFKQPDIPDNQRLGAVSSLIFSTPNPDQRRAVFNQLVDAGLPALTEGAVEAAARGDTGAANRLMQAALVDPAKLPKNDTVKPADIDSTIYSNIWEPGAVGDAAYGVSYGDAASLERAQRGSDLMKKAVTLRVSQGEDLQTAVDGAKKDLFGDVKVYNGEGGVTANLPVPSDTDTSTLTAGLTSAKTSFKAALDLQRDRILNASKPPPGPTGNFDGMISKGNIDLAARPVVKNDDGTISTVRSMSFDEDGKEILVPTVSPDGKILSNDEAVDLYHKTGQNLGIFKNGDAADAYAVALHDAQAKYYGSTAGDGTHAVLDATTQNRMADILDNGVFVQTGTGVGLRDPYTGQFVPGADGVTPLSLPLDKIIDMGRNNPIGGNDAAARFSAGQANTGLVQPAPVQQYLKGKPVDQNDTSSAASQWMRGQPVTAK